MEIAINSELEAIINDNVSEVENKLSTQFDEFYNFDQDIIITIPKEQTKVKKIYKTKLEVTENIVEVNYNQTVVLDTTTTTTTVVNVQDSTPPASLHDQPEVGVGAGNVQEENKNTNGDGLTLDQHTEVDSEDEGTASEGTPSEGIGDTPSDGGLDSSSETSDDSDNTAAPADAPVSSDSSSSDNSQSSSDSSSSSSDSSSSSSDSGSESSPSSEGAGA
ncbi:MAG: hypothetical protein WC422_00285 [Candidatus Paceibacterota bacterium]|jgi:hypothetical protein